MKRRGRSPPPRRDIYRVCIAEALAGTHTETGSFIKAPGMTEKLTAVPVSEVLSATLLGATR